MQSCNSSQSSGMVKLEQASSTVALQLSSTLYCSLYSDTLLLFLLVSFVSQVMLFRSPPAPSLRRSAASWNFPFFAFLFPVCSVNLEYLLYFFKKFRTALLSHTITSRAFVRQSSLTVAVHRSDLVSSLTFPLLFSSLPFPLFFLLSLRFFSPFPFFF